MFCTPHCREWTSQRAGLDAEIHAERGKELFTGGRPPMLRYLLMGNAAPTEIASMTQPLCRI